MKGSYKLNPTPMAVAGYHGKENMAFPNQHSFCICKKESIKSSSHHHRVPIILIHAQICPQYPMSGFWPQTMCMGIYIRQLLSK